MEIVWKFLWKSAASMVSAPLTWVYMRGPSLLGFWESQSEADICAALSHADASFWLSSPANADMCSELIRRKSDAFVVGTVFVGLSWLLIVFVGASLCRVVVVEPIVSAIATGPQLKPKKATTN